MGEMSVYNKKRIANSYSTHSNLAYFLGQIVFKWDAATKELSELILVILTKMRQSQITQYVVAELFI